MMEKLVMPTGDGSPQTSAQIYICAALAEAYRLGVASCILVAAT